LFLLFLTHNLFYVASAKHNWYKRVCWDNGELKTGQPIIPFFHHPNKNLLWGWGMYKKILVPLDGSELAKAALDEAVKLAICSGAEIILFQVVTFMPIYGSPELVTPLIIDEKQKEAAEKYLANLAEELKTRGLRVTALVKTGQQVAVEIIDFAKESGVDLIVMGTHGRSGITRWVLGSVTHKVLVRAETPVLLLRSKG
jgi:nucleotide-binding universal stress UspA family protein